ncbi:MAG: hypothetical protein ABIN89_30205 [Chitinophagaceae bacterium]
MKNPYNVSVPRYAEIHSGYAEIHSGYADTAIKNYELIPNPNPNVLEFFNKQPGFQNKVAAFISWNASDYYLNEARSGFPAPKGEMKTPANIFFLKNNRLPTTYSGLNDLLISITSLYLSLSIYKMCQSI